jgi:DNA-binding response OmpR family regulator
MHATQTILLAEDDKTTRTFLADNLTADGYKVVVAENVEDALRKLECERPAAVIADLNGASLALVDKVRAADELTGRLDPETPLMLLSRRAHDIDRLRGYQRGCDDYLAKPFSYPELLARLRRRLARAERRTSGTIAAGELVVDVQRREVRLRGEPIALTRQEFALLRTLAGEPTRVFTKAELLRGVWGYRSLGCTRTLDSHACRLRRKLCGPAGGYVINVWGIGYRLIDELPGNGSATGEAA